jgi:hypothetical protein
LLRKFPDRRDNREIYRGFFAADKKSLVFGPKSADLVLEQGINRELPENNISLLS